MNHGARQIDRLLPRHEAKTGMELDWNVRMVRKGLRQKEEVCHPAQILDLSLEGALVQVPDSQTHEPGDRVAVRFRGLDGHAQIVHRRTGGEGYYLYGVRFLPRSGFSEALNAAVGEMRGHRDELDLAWNRPR